MYITYHYMALGSGRQGTAAAHGVARFGDAHLVTMADADLEIALSAAARINELLAKSIAVGIQLNAAD